MGGNFAPELKRLLSESGCRFERHGKGDHDIWVSLWPLRLTPIRPALAFTETPLRSVFAAHRSAFSG